MFRPTPSASFTRPMLSGTSSTLAKWNISSRAVNEAAGRNYLPGIRQPRGARLALVTSWGSTAKEDEPMSVMPNPNGAICSVNNPDPTGPPTICTTVPMGCSEPDTLLGAP